MVESGSEITLGDWVIVVLGAFLCWLIPAFLTSCGEVDRIQPAQPAFSYTMEALGEDIEEEKVILEVPSRPSEEADKVYEHHLLSIPLEIEGREFGNDTGIKGYPISDKDANLLAALVYLEGRGESFECQRAICSLVLNRYDTGKYSSIEEVIYAPGQFSVAPMISSVDLSLASQQYEVIETIRKYGKNIPDYVIYFRAGHYHSWEDAEDYVPLNNTYFSSSKKLKKKLEEQNQ